MPQQFRVYTDVADALTNGLLASETASLVGLNSTLNAPISAGATSVQVASQADAGNAPGTGSFPLWILDGQNSEQVTASATTPRSTSFTIAAPGTAYAHAAGVNLTSAGVAGCLASLIREASSVVERICRQGPDGGNRSLFQQTWVEKLSGPSQHRAAFDVEGSLLLRPYRFPIVSASSVTVQMLNSTALSIDLTYLMLADAARYLTVPVAQSVNVNPPSTIPWWPVFSRGSRFVATLTYVGGAVPGLTLDSVPPDIRRACVYLVMDRLASRRNPGGFASVRQGDYQFEARLRGDTTGKSILRIDAEGLLEPYTQQW